MRKKKKNMGYYLKYSSIEAHRKQKSGGSKAKST